jgi:hypothetical protein
MQMKIAGVARPQLHFRQHLFSYAAALAMARSSVRGSKPTNNAAANQLLTVRNGAIVVPLDDR